MPTEGLGLAVFDEAFSKMDGPRRCRMSRRVVSDADRLFHDLLHRHEANPLASRIIGYVDEDGFVRVEERGCFVAELTSAQAADAVEVRRRRQFGERILSHIRPKRATAWNSPADLNTCHDRELPFLRPPRP